MVATSTATYAHNDSECVATKVWDFVTEVWNRHSTQTSLAFVLKGNENNETASDTTGFEKAK